MRARLTFLTGSRTPQSDEINLQKKGTFLNPRRLVLRCLIGQAAGAHVSSQTKI